MFEVQSISNYFLCNLLVAVDVAQTTVCCMAGDGPRSWQLPAEKGSLKAQFHSRPGLRSFVYLVADHAVIRSDLSRSRWDQEVRPFS